MSCVHGRPAGSFCPHCAGIARTYTAETVVVPPYTFRPFEPIDSTIRPFVVSPEGISAGVAPEGGAAGAELGSAAGGQAVRLVDLNPEWMNGHPERQGVGIWFDCPGSCCAGKPSPGGNFDPEEGKTKKQRLCVQFEPPLDGRGPFATSARAWARSGDTFETLTLTPSIDASGFGHWHGFITNGAIVGGI